MRKLRILTHAEAGFLGTIVVLIGLMLATIIASMVLFAFVDAGQTVASTVESNAVTGVNGTTFYFALDNTPASTTPGWTITTTGTKGTFTIASANYTYISANNTLSCNAIGKYNTSIRIAFNTLAHDTVGSVNTYAIIVFVMLAIVPLIIVGGVMLKSLGFFSGGTGKP